jgi:hypothetical protein
MDFLGTTYQNLTRLEHVVNTLATSSPLDALAVAVEMKRTSERCTHRAVIDARDDGATWEEIGKALGITKQAAYDRWAGVAG